jgi:endogenous inhibitor of DNA gyrase (YacG/DUF329 family)
VEGSSFVPGPAVDRTCEHSVQVDGRWTLVRYCGYCWAEYVEPKASKAYFCSKECRDRNGAWNRWVADSNAAAVSGDVNRPGKAGAALPAGGASLVAAVGRFQLEFELEGVAA